MTKYVLAYSPSGEDKITQELIEGDNYQDAVMKSKFWAEHGDSFGMEPDDPDEEDAVPYEFPQERDDFISDMLNGDIRVSFFDLPEGT